MLVHGRATQVVMGATGAIGAVAGTAAGHSSFEEGRADWKTTHALYLGGSAMIAAAVVAGPATGASYITAQRAGALSLLMGVGAAATGAAVVGLFRD